MSQRQATSPCRQTPPLAHGSLPRMVRPPSPEQAPDCVTCIGCLGWPHVYRTHGNRRLEIPAMWIVSCRQCNRLTTGSTREKAVAEWNDINHRGPNDEVQRPRPRGSLQPVVGLPSENTEKPNKSA